MLLLLLLLLLQLHDLLLLHELLLLLLQWQDLVIPAVGALHDLHALRRREGLRVRVGEGCYVIPLAVVEECIELSLEEDMRSRGRSFITLRDRLVPFIRLREMFATGTKPDPHQKIVVITTGGERVGLVVDQIIGSHQTVIKSMSPLHRDVATFAGATILGDGSVALILDAVQLVAFGQEQEERLRAAG